MPRKRDARNGIDPRYAQWKECPHCYSFAPFHDISERRKITKSGDRNGTYKKTIKRCGNCKRTIELADWTPTPQKSLPGLFD